MTAADRNLPLRRSRRGVIRAMGLLFPFSALLKSVDVHAAVASLNIGGPDHCGPWIEQSLSTNRFLTSPVEVAGNPVTAVIDSGLSRTAIVSDLAQKLKLPVLGADTAYGLGGAIPITRYLLSSLTIGPITIEDAVVMNVEQARLPLPRNISVVIGHDVLQRLALDIDFPNDIMRLCSTAPEVSADYNLVRMTLGQEKIPTIALKIEGKAVSAAMVDTGSNAACTIARPYAEALGLLNPRPKSTVMTAGADGTTIDLVTTLRDVTIGGSVLRDIPVTISEAWVLPTPINLGWPLLRAFRVWLDSGAGAMWLKPDAEALAKPFPRDRSGIGAVRLPDHLLVRHVAKDSPAERAGLVAGNIVIAIDGRKVDDNYPRPGERQGYKAAGTRLDLQLSDGRHIKLVLADYF